MIPKIQTRGMSFKGLATYLTHDPKAKTADRVAWTHTLNLANDHVPSAVDEMLWTARQAELLKQEAGVRAGGRATENPVKHFSLNWAIGDNPTREHMIETTEDFLRHMKWDERQAVLVAHNDKAYAHVHVMLNTVHPETGLQINESFERRRASAWALEYEKENGMRCEQRQRKPEEREDSMTRDAWMAFKENQKTFERDEKMLSENTPKMAAEKENAKIARFSDWKILKENQREERVAFFADGKMAFSELRTGIYREVREEFRERWGEYYTARRDDTDPAQLASMKVEVLADQKAMLDGRREEAFSELRETRNALYKELLGDQKEARGELRRRQESGRDTSELLRRAEDKAPQPDVAKNFREAAEETSAAPASKQRHEEPRAPTGTARHNRARAKSGADVSASIATGLGFGFLDFIGSIADGLVAGNPAPRRRDPEPEPEGPDLFMLASEQARRDEQRREQEEASRDWRRKQRDAGE